MCLVNAPVWARKAWFDYENRETVQACIPIPGHNLNTIVAALS